MAEATVQIDAVPYKMIALSGGGNTLIADEPETLGGGNLGFSPDELLCASLGACTAATLRMYADRKGWNMEKATVQVHFDRKPGEASVVLHRRIRFAGDFTAEQAKRLLEIADKCPMHKLLSNQISIQTVIHTN